MSIRNGLAFAAMLSPAIVASELSAQARLFVSRPGVIVELRDLNGDGDYFDFGETINFAAGLPASMGSIVLRGDRLFAVANSPPRVFLIEDLNGDGDAFDFAEVSEYALFPGGTGTLAGLAVRDDGALLIVDQTNGRLLRVEDLNGDGDALDIAEIVIAADGMSAPTSVAVRPDGKLLIAQNNAAVPVRILQDRDGDGDYFGFAENISYAEGMAPGLDLLITGNDRAFLTRPAAHEILLLHDRNRDDDVLDFGEVLPFAANAMSVRHLALSADGLIAAAGDAAGTLYRVCDLNGDGDALDFGEVLPIAAGLTQIAGIAVESPPATAPECINGDADGNGVVNISDVPLFVGAILGTTPPEAPCRVDMNDDGALDGRDVQLFVVVLLE